MGKHFDEACACAFFGQIHNSKLMDLSDALCSHSCVDTSPCLFASCSLLLLCPNYDISPP